MCGLYTDSPIDPYYLALDKCDSTIGNIVDVRFNFKILSAKQYGVDAQLQPLYNYTCLNDHCPDTAPLLREDSLCVPITNCIYSEYNRLTVTYLTKTYYYCIKECFSEVIPTYNGDYSCITPCPPSEFEILN